jgi:uncharacterized protein YjdB
MRSTVFQATFVLLMASATACSDPAQPVNPDPVVAVEGVRVTPQSIVLPRIGATWQLSAVVSPANATDKALEWESTDTTVASVNAFGLVTARGAGAGIFVTAYTHDGGFQSSANVTVSP